VKILALDLSTRRGSIAVCSKEKILFQNDWDNDRRSAAPFFLALEAAAELHGPPNLVVVGLGPGSYTGTRIAVAAAMGLTRTAAADLTGLPSVVAMAEETEYIVVGDAKRASFFVASVTGEQREVQIELLPAEELPSRLAAIQVPIYTSDLLPEFPKAERRFPSALQLAELARRFPDKLYRAPLSPIYLREPHITVPGAQK